MQDRLFNQDYRDMIECLQREGVEFMLVGGYAVALHGWPRMTFDIDFWIMANPQNAAAVMRALKAFGAPLMDLKEEDFININPNYDSIDVQIVHQDLVIVPNEDVVVTILTNTDTFMYDGLEHSVSGYQVSFNTTLYTESDFMYKGDSIVKGIEVGEYLFTLQNTDFVNLNPNFENVQFDIKPQNLVITANDTIEVTITENSAMLTYNGTEQSVTGYKVEINSDLYTVSDFIYNGDSIAKGTDVGEYGMNLLTTDFVNQNTNFTNVKFTIVKGALSIVPMENVTVQIVEHGDTVTYDGETHEVSGFDILCENKLYDKTFVRFSGKDTVSGVNVGSYDMNLQESDFENTNPNFDNVQFSIVKDSLVIVPNTDVIVTITGKVDTFTYDGLTKSVKGYEVSINNEIYHSSDIQFIGNASVSGVNVGAYEMTMKEEDFINMNPNFESVKFVIEQGHLVINPLKNVIVTVSENSDHFVYDGNEHSVIGYTISIDNPLYDESSIAFDGEAIVKGTEVGEYDMHLDPANFSNINPNFTNVIFDVIENPMTITPMENIVVTIKEKADTFVFDDADHIVSGYEIVDISSSLYKTDDFTYAGDSTVTGHNVGSYMMNLKSEDFSNQHTNFINVSFEIIHDLTMITPLKHVVVTITEPSDTFQYDGEEHILTGFNFSASTDLYRKEFINFTGIDTVRGTEVGSYKMNLKVEDFENNNTNFDSVQFVIVPDSMFIKSNKSVTILLTMNGDTVIYDGNEHFVSGYTVTYISDTLYHISDFKYEGPAEDTIARRTNVGKTEMELPVENFVNYNHNFAHVNFLVAHNALVVLPKPALTVYIKENADTFEFDGDEHVVMDYTFTPSDTLYKKSDFVYHGETPILSVTNAGKYTMNLQDTLFENLNANYDTVTFVVIPDTTVVSPIKGVVVSIKGKRDTMDYDGTEHNLKGSIIVANHPLYNVSTDMMTVGNPKQASGLQSGVYFMNLKPSDFININPNFEDVTFKVEDGYLCIQKINRKIVISANSSSKVYDGIELINKGYSYTRTFLDSIGDYIVAQVEGSIINVGSINNEITAYRIYNHNGEDVTDNYTSVILTDGLLEIKPRRITMESVSGEKEYDGKPLVVDSVIIGGEGLASVDSVLFTVTGSQLDAGESANTFEYKLVGDSQLIKNYIVDVIEGTLTVVPNSTPISIIAASDEKYHDNLPLENPGYRYTQNVLAEGDSLVVIVEGSITEVGKTDNVIVDYYVLRDGEDITFNYTFGDIVNGILEVYYSEHPYIVYGDEGKIIFQDVNSPVRVYDVLGRYIFAHRHTGNSEYFVEDYYEWRVPKQGTYYVRILGETIKVITK